MSFVVPKQTNQMELTSTENTSRPVDIIDYIPETPPTKSKKRKSFLTGMEKITLNLVKKDVQQPVPCHSTPKADQQTLPDRSTTYIDDISMISSDSEDDCDDEDLEKTNYTSFCDFDASNVSFDDPDWEIEDFDSEPRRKEIKRAHLSVVMSKEACVKAKKCVAFNDCIIQLIKGSVGKTCTICSSDILFTEKMQGTCLCVSWKCSVDKKHLNRDWHSQPLCGGMRAGNLLLPAAAILSGNHYEKVALMAKFLKLGFVSHQTFYRLQTKYIAPAVNQYYLDMEDGILSRGDTDMVVSGDGRNDSPGHSAMYCTYSLMDFNTKEIIKLKVIDVRETNFNSANMEKKGFLDVMTELMNQRVVCEVITDGNIQIKSMMKKEPIYRNIVHQFDVWHVAKTISKKISKIAKLKANRDLLQWIPSIKKHLWWCAENCQGDERIMKASWVKIMHHVQNKHVWVDHEQLTPGKCGHEIPLPEEERDKPWLEPGSTQTQALREIIFSRSALNNMPYVRNFRHTSHLELFHSLILTYCPKRVAFDYMSYKLRNQLAAIDHNKHLGRPQATKKDGTPRYQIAFSKASRNYSAIPIPVPKTYTYIEELMMEILYYKEISGIKMADPHKRIPEDPKNKCTRRTNVPKPSKEELIIKRQKRES